MERNTFQIPVERVADLEHEIGKLNKRAEKLGVAPIEIIKGEFEDRAETGEGGVQTFRVFQAIEIIGDSPKLNGWQFVATLEHDENGTLIRRLPHADESFDLTPFRTATPDHCDHCGYKRRRNDTYVVGHDDGTLKQVGSNCLKDFIGHQSPHLIARYLEAVADLIENVSSGGYSESSAPQRYGVLTFLSHAAAMIREHGWVSRGAANNSYGALTATADLASDNLYLTERGKPAVEPTSDDLWLAQHTADWVRSLSEDDLANDYMYNLYTSLKGDSIPSRQFGIAASAISAYQRAQERELERQRRFADRVNEHFGTEGEKVTFTAVIKRITWIEDRYNGGTKPLYIFRTDDGFDAKWFSSRDLGFEQGDHVTVTGCVKAHEDHREYGKSTVVTRCKMEKII